MSNNTRRSRIPLLRKQSSALDVTRRAALMSLRSADEPQVRRSNVTRSSDIAFVGGGAPLPAPATGGSPGTSRTKIEVSTPGSNSSALQTPDTLLYGPGIQIAPTSVQNAVIITAISPGLHPGNVGVHGL